VMGSCWIYSRPGGATSEKWIILEGKGESGLDCKFGAPRW
jgi:hypothetical protein